MLVSFDAKLAFLAMTKSGSTAIQNALAPHCDLIYTRSPRATHMPYMRFNRFVRPYLVAIGQRKVETCCVMRHPIGWLGSWYQYRMIEALWAPDVCTKGLSFEEFAIRVVEEEDPGARHMGRQHRFLCDSNGVVGVDMIFRYEDMARFETFLSERFGAPLAFPRHNVSPRKPLGLSPETTRRLEAYCEKDFEIYDSL